MLLIEFSARMKRDVKRMQKRGKDMGKLRDVLEVLAQREPLPKKHKDHQLKGNLDDMRECHIEPDWLLVYQIKEDKLILSCTATGSHDDLFKE